MLDKVLNAIDSRKDKSLAMLKEFLRIPSVSTKPDHKPDMIRCANWLKDQLHRAKQDVLKADLCLISDTDQFRRGLPAITYGLRGLVYEEVKITGPDHDLHSGMYGGAVPNPANVLCEILATLHKPDGSVNIPGFYDDVETVKPEEKQIWGKLPHDDQDYAKHLGLSALSGEAGFSTLERTWVRPTCDINGL